MIASENFKVSAIGLPGTVQHRFLAFSMSNCEESARRNGTDQSYKTDRSHLLLLYQNGDALKHFRLQQVTPLKFVGSPRTRQNFAVHNVCWGASRCDVNQALTSTAADIREAFVRPADRVRRQNHIVKRQ